MAKYSTGGSSDAGGGDSCELCGTASDSLREANVAGARLEVCPDCAPHDDAAKGGGGGGGGDGGQQDEATERRKRKKRAAQNVAKARDAVAGDSSHWEEEGTNYDDDPLPYLKKDYGDLLVQARQDAGFQREELAEQLSVDESDLLAVEQGRANQAGIGGGLISALEDELDVELSE